MKHIQIQDTGATKAEVKNVEWKHTGIAIGELVNQWSGRRDVIAEMVETTEVGVPALFKPAVAEVQVATSIAFAGVNPYDVGDFREKEVQYEFPQVTGAVLHEALHARYSLFDLAESAKELTGREMHALMLLEEGRIEAQGAREMPWGKNFLKACAMDLVIQDSEEAFGEKKTIESAGNMVGLVHGRILAGVLDASDVKDLKKLIDQTLGEETVQQLEEVLEKAQQHINHRDATELHKLARRWVKILDKEMKKHGEVSEEEAEAQLKEFVKATKKAMQEARESAEISCASDLHDQQRQEEWEQQAQDAKDAADEKVKNEEAAKTVFSRRSTGISGSKLVEERLPNSKERIAAVTVAQMLQKAKYRDRSMTEVNSVTPPGRLRTRTLVQANAMKARGVVQPTEPWRKKVRKQTDQPNLKIGVMVDVSGSMADAMEPMATTAWVLSEAGKRVQARTSMVYFGSSAFPTLKPGQSLDKVRVYTAHDSTEEFDEAFRALDGSLNLLHGSDARLLVVVSDGYYRPDQTERAKHWVKKCEQAGVAVLWMPFSPVDDSPKRILRGNKSAQLLDVGSNPASVAQLIGKAASTALSKVGSRR